MDTITSALRRLAMSANEQTIYLSLLRDGQATARLLADRTGMTRPSVYDQIRKLMERNLVVELAIEGKAHFAAADIKYLDALLDDQIDRLEQSRALLATHLPLLKDSIKTVTPKIRFYEGEEGVKQILKDMMWHDHLCIEVVWPVTSMNAVFAESFLRWFDERRQIRHITAHVQLVTGSQKYVSDGGKVGRASARPTVYHPFTHPKDIVTVCPNDSITMASIVYANKVAYISSSREAYGFIVESAEFAGLQKL